MPRDYEHELGGTRSHDPRNARLTCAKNQDGGWWNDKRICELSCSMPSTPGATGAAARSCRPRYSKRYSYSGTHRSTDEPTVALARSSCNCRTRPADASRLFERPRKPKHVVIAAITTDNLNPHRQAGGRKSSRH